MRRMIFALAVVAVLGIAVAPGHAQLTFPENHYLVYNVVDPLNHFATLQFRDQWMGWEGPQDMILEKFANPLWEKNGQQVLYDPLVHHTWWRLNPIPNPVRRLLSVHQFGSYILETGDAVYLLNPADKDNQIPPPEEWPRRANHYLCYEILVGEPLTRGLFMVDQWGQHDNVALDPYCFCNPVEKIDFSTGEVHPIVDPTMHLTCYLVNPNPSGRAFTYDDQFVRNGNIARDECLICFPSLKDDTLPSEETNWGRIKALFGDE